MRISIFAVDSYWLYRIILCALLSTSLAGCSGELGFISQTKSKTQVTNKKTKTKITYEYRDLRFSSNAQGYRPEIKVGMVVDNSSSMRDEQSALSEGMAQLLESFRSERLNLKFLIYSTSQEGSNKAADDFTEYRYNDPTTGNPIVTTDPAVLALQIPGLIRKDGKKLSAPIGQPVGTDPLQIRSDMNTAEFDMAVSRIQSTISSIGTNGSDNERGICSLGRMLAEERPDSKIFSQGDLAAFLVITDANDTNSTANCTAYAESSYGASNDFTPFLNTNCRPGAVCTEPAATEWKYRQYFLATQQDWSQIRYHRATCWLDGQYRDPCPLENSEVYRWVRISSYPFALPLTNEYSMTNCPTELTNYINARTDWEDIRTPTHGENVCQYFTYKSSQAIDYVDRSNLPFDLCNPGQTLSYNHAGVTGTAANLAEFLSANFSNLTGYAPWLCHNNHLVNSVTGGRYRPAYGTNTPAISIGMPFVLDQLTEQTTPSPTFNHAIIQRARQLFGEQGFIYSSILHSQTLVDTAEENGEELTCMGPPESEGTAYLDLAALIPTQSRAFPICLANYTPALQPLRDFIRYVIDNVYQVQLDNDEKIMSVSVSRNGVEIALENDDYDIMSDRVAFAPGTLERNDEIKVQIRKTIRTII